MARLANQIRVVILNYATRPQCWAWVAAITLCVALGLLVGPTADDAGHRSNQASDWFFSFYWAIFVAAMLGSQITLQFAHPRAHLTPDFAIPHLAVGLGLILIATLAFPALFALAHKQPILVLTAGSSFVIAVFSSTILSRTFFWLVLFAVVGPSFFGYSVFSPPSIISIPILVGIIVASWLIIALSAMRLTKFSEEFVDYWSIREQTGGNRRRSPYEMGGSSWDWKAFPLGQILTDNWHNRIGRFSGNTPAPVVRLLRYGFGAWPPELEAIWWLAITIAVSLAMVWGEDTDDIADPLATMRLFPVLFALFFPGALAVEPLGKRGAVMSSELMLPMTREQFIDGLIRAAAWNLVIIWIAFNAVAVFLLWSVPGLEPSFLRLFSYLFLSGAIAYAFFSLALETALWDSLLSRIAASLFFVIASVVLFLIWWFARDDFSDVPFLAAGGFMILFGRLMFSGARQDWLDLELGAEIAD